MENRQELLGTVAVMLANPNCQAVVIDRQPGHSPFVMAFSVPWNTLRDMAEKKESLTAALVAGGPVERGEPQSTSRTFEVHDWYYYL